jgi:hypothetical protein
MFLFRTAAAANSVGVAKAESIIKKRLMIGAKMSTNNLQTELMDQYVSEYSCKYCQATCPLTASSRLYYRIWN